MKLDRFVFYVFQQIQLAYVIKTFQTILFSWKRNVMVFDGEMLKKKKIKSNV